MVLKPSVYQVLVGIFASLGAFLLGYDLVSASTTTLLYATSLLTLDRVSSPVSSPATHSSTSSTRTQLVPA